MDGKVEGNEDKLSAFARYTAALHKAGILHLDYSPGNILIHQNETNEYSFSLVDVNRMQLLSDIDCDMVCRNMCRLCISREICGSQEKNLRTERYKRKNKIRDTICFSFSFRAARR